jgi:predicted component of type VI protein secretion system
VEVLRAIAPDDWTARKRFAGTMLENLDNDNEFLRKIVFSDTSAFKVPVKVNNLKARIYELERHHATVDVTVLELLCGVL